MSSVYIKTFSLPSEEAEVRFLGDVKETCYEGFYPFGIFPEKELFHIEFEPVTIFCGGNGSGKTTLLNLIGEKAGISRHSPFNKSPFFERFVSMCGLSGRVPENSEILTSDDVFDYVLDMRRINQKIDMRRQELFDEFASRRYAGARLGSLDDYEDFKETMDARRQSKSQFVRKRVMGNTETLSNGQSAVKYFTDHIRDNGVYILDEPENSLSVSLQKRLCAFLCDAARYFGCQLIIATHSPVMLSMRDALIYDLDSLPCITRPWTELENVREYYNFFEEHKSEFRK